MAKITPINLIGGMSGKLGKNSEHYFVTNRQTGRIHTSMCVETDYTPSAAQVAARAKFAQRVKDAYSWLATNGPASEHPLDTEAYQKALTAYKKQRKRKIATFFGYVSSKIIE